MATLLDGRDLAAAYGGRPVFAGLSLRLGCGIFALRGPNGSGKSTLLRLLAGAQHPTRGEVTIAGRSLRQNPVAARQLLSYVPDDNPIYPFMTGRELIAFVAAAKRVSPLPVLEGIAPALGLAPHLDARFDALSLGTQKKLLIAAAWLGHPSVLLLDEPSNGLDGEARQWLVSALRDAAPEAAVLCATHDASLIAGTGAAVIEIGDLVADDDAITNHKLSIQP